jgi:hypothetical protein
MQPIEETEIGNIVENGDQYVHHKRIMLDNTCYVSVDISFDGRFIEFSPYDRGCSSETLVTTYKITRCHKPEYHNRVVRKRCLFVSHFISGLRLFWTN